jgi:hypothetical protein
MTNLSAEISTTNTATTPPVARKHFSRFKAFAIHFGISLAVFLVLLALLIGTWYPGLFFDTDGGWEGLRLLLAVDMVLGPLLTLIIYRPNKRGLMLDLALIAAVQIGCLAYGVHMVYAQRPLAIAYVDKRFNAVSQGSFDVAGTDSSSLKAFPGKYPKQIYINLPKDEKARKDLLRAQVSQGLVHARPSLFLDYAEHAKEVVTEGGITIKQYRQDNPDKADALADWLKAQNYTDTQIVWVPYTARYQDTFLILDAQTGKILGHAPKKFMQ